MANVATGVQRYLAQSLNPQATTGVWAYQLAASIISFHKAAAATVSVVSFAIPHMDKGGLYQEGAVTKISLQYKVATAVLTTAATAILHKLTTNPTTGVTTEAAEPQTLTFSGTDATGGTSAVGTFNAIVTVTTPNVLDDNTKYVLEITFNEAATTVLDVYGANITYQ